MAERPVLLGMNNPLSDDPKYALACFPTGSSGHRLYKMLDAVRPTLRAQYMRDFDRRNVCPSREWNPALVPRTALWDSLRGRRVLVCGQAVVNALWLPRTRPLLWRLDYDVLWCEVPHPSGLNRAYSDPVLKYAVGLRLEQVLEDYLSGG